MTLSKSVARMRILLPTISMLRSLITKGNGHSPNQDSRPSSNAHEDSNILSSVLTFGFLGQRRVSIVRRRSLLVPIAKTGVRPAVTEDEGGKDEDHDAHGDVDGHIDEDGDLDEDCWGGEENVDEQLSDVSDSRWGREEGEGGTIRR